MNNFEIPEFVGNEEADSMIESFNEKFGTELERDKREITGNEKDLKKFFSEKPV